MDWTDLESFSRPPPAKGGDCADPEASWGHRKNNLLRSEDELFYGYYLSAGIMMPEENGPAVPELARRATVSSCRHDPVRAFTPVLTAMPGQGIPLGDILSDSGYAHRDAEAWAIPLRTAGAQLIQDLHPLFVDRTTGRHAGGGGCAGRASAGRNHATLSREDAWCCRVDSSSGTSPRSGCRSGAVSLRLRVSCRGWWSIRTARQ